MTATASPVSAASLPGPPGPLPGRPDAVVDLQTPAGVELVGGQWRYSDCRIEEIEFVELGAPDDPLGPGTVPNRTYDVVPHAEGADFEDSGWRQLEPEETMLRLANGRVCCNWYRLTVTIPETVGEFDVSGSTIVFETVVDDYAEVWVNGALPLVLGDRGGHVAAGFNAPNRVVLTRDAQPGNRFVIAVFGINGPISASPRNYIWMRSASLDFYEPCRARLGEDVPFEVHGDVPLAGGVEAIATGFDRIDSLLAMPDGSVLFASAGTIYRWHDGAVSVFRAKSDAGGLAFTPDGLLTIAQPRSGRVMRVNPHGDTTVLHEGTDDVRAVAYRADGRLVTHAGAYALAASPGRAVFYAVDGEGILTIDAADEVDVLCDFDDEPTGVAVGEDGRLYVAGAAGVVLLTHEGDRLGAISLDEPVRTLAFAGNTLYLGGDTTLFRVLTTTKGAS